MSWELLESDRIIKTTELSDFINTEMNIPTELISFFGGVGERLAIIYQQREYPSYLETEGSNAKLKWSRVLIRKLGEAFPDYQSWFQADRDDTKTPRLEIIKANEVFNLRLVIEDGENNPEDIKKSEVVTTVAATAAGLQVLLEKWISGYPNYYPRDFRFSFKDVINEDIPKVIEGFGTIQSGHYQVLGFAGQTQWAEIPWVKVTDKQINGSNDQGLYLAYILAMDSRKLYLAIVYGEEGLGLRSLSEKASEYRKRIATGNYQTNHQEVLLANASLVSGIVCYREYSESEIPEDAVLAAEFEDFRKMYALCLTKTDKADSVDKADGVDKVEADKASTGGEPGQAVIPEMDHNNNVIVTENQKITKPLANQQPLDQEESAIASPAAENVAEAVESTSEDWQNDESHSEENKLQENKLQENKLAEIKLAENRIKKSHRDEIAIQENSSEEIFLASKKDEKNRVLFSPGKNDYLTPKLQVVQAKMANLGYYYPAELIKSYYLSLKSKPFVIIKGRIGSGKSSFPRLFAEAIGASQENGRFKRLLVGKNWEDHRHLFGRLDSRGHFIPGPIMTCLKTAKESPDKPHFFILDEMDQSPTADYLRLLLEGINGNKEPFLTREDFGADITAFREYGNLSFPDNLYLIATINQGAGSFPVDSRVIDSGNVIEMPVVEIGIFSDYGSPAEASDWENSAFKIDSQARGLPEILERLINLLNKLQQLLIKHGCPIGYRGKNEILAFGINSGAEGLYSEVEVIDLAILQRVIPALASDQKTAIPVYQSLAVFLLAGDAQESLMQLPLNRFISQYEALLKAAAIPCPRSGQEILKRLKQKK